MRRRTVLAGIAGCLAVGAAGPVARAAAAPVKVRVGWAQTPGHLAPLVAELARRHPQVLPNQGKTYDFEPIRYAGSTPQIEAMAIKQLEIAAFSDSAFALAITNAHLDVQIVADVLQTGKPGYWSGEYIVAKDGPVKKIEDLKGRRVATNAIGSEADSTMRAMLRKHGIRDSDVTTVEANFANQPAMIEGGKVDMIELLPQFAAPLMDTGKYRVLFTAGQVHGVSDGVFWGMRADFIAAHRPALVDFFTDYMRALHWFLDKKNRTEALAIAAAVTHAPPKNLAYAFTDHDFYRPPDLVPLIGAIQKEIDEDVGLGVLPKRVVISPKYVDLSLIKEAKGRLDGHGA
ncbi:MAG TPA: ABC transporter substrate-binding protein [Stellaceae bacterium]|nr:ABC transporter substrate-binding protein [Stellaceae bacterium]